MKPWGWNSSGGGSGSGASLPDLSPSPAGTLTQVGGMTINAKGLVTAAAEGGVTRVEGTSPAGGAVGHSAELYLGPANGYSYSPGGAGYLPGVPFASTLKRVVFRCAAMGVDSTVRLRNSAGTQLWSKVLTAGQTSINDAISVALAQGVLVQLSVEPASGGPTVDAWSFGWFREVA